MAKDLIDSDVIDYDYDRDELLRQIRILEDEKRYLESELRRLQGDIERLRKEINRMKSPPLLVGTIEDIIDDNRIVVRSSAGPTFIVNASSYVPKEKIKPGAKVALNKQTFAIVHMIPESYDPAITAAEIIEKPRVTYDDIGGLKKQIREIREAVELPLLKPELYKKVGIEPPKGVLLAGPPGTGKTLLAKAVAHHTHATFIRTVGSELVRKYIGEGAKLVRELFDLARKKAPSIVFIDEIDAIGARRLDMATSGDREVQRTLMQLLAELDGFEPLDNVKIIAATNRPDILDEALLRPGRFDRIIQVPYPDYDARIEILKIHTRRMNLKDVNLEKIAKKTDGFSGADLKVICMEAGMFAIRDERDYVTQEDFENAIRKFLHADDLRKEIPGEMFA
ncbi:proteasome-activating nucleotidase [Candidatus Aciduliprofundum boonei]|uniref:Proteasome-activating nucleotidase n=1 Tax=Aciduliprofundum boonei (strain DSM 19572 / T469) TaxID=439481 RepID=B5ID40_ACIB4|nr:proteasome-activating nucleotidase [Candidatus Aciduliprofundum boonei]ADD09191.1 26S proteasome subunit P45 family [Aciduliprofundum boonei T469]EDY35801.1 26S proteasome subunit P45 family [Aciduliprofundum boonei T469]HII55845.1 proteasome-activating nucleotidase [Candidatus Aciduliprofundum boonei]